MSTWKTVKLSDIGTIVGGATPATSHDEYYNGDIPWLTPKDLAGYAGRYISRGERNISRAGLESCSAKILPKNSILFSSRAPIGYIAIAQNDLCTNQGFKSIIPNDKVDHLFLYYLLKYNKEKIESLGSGTTFKEVSAATMREVEVCLPEDVLLQKKIARILNSIDLKIENNNCINNNLEQQTATLFKAWFTDFIPFGKTLPLKWQKTSLGKIAKIGAGGDKPQKVSSCKTKDTPFPIYSNGITDEGLYGFTNHAKIIEESVTVSARGTIGFVCLRHTPYLPIVRLITLVPDTNFISAKYLYLYLKQLNILGTGTTQQQLTVPNFRKTEVLLPTKKTMDTFTDIITPLFETIWINQAENNTLASLRDTLLPKLMSGEINASDIAL